MRFGTGGPRQRRVGIVALARRLLIDLWYRHPRKHVVDQVCGALDHAPPSTARTERTPLARKRDQPIEATHSTPKAGEATAERPTPKKVAELLLDEAR